MSTIEEEYSLVKNFDDFIKTNIKFLNGIYDHTAYHYAPVNDETIPLLYDLKIVNKLGFFTHNGQPNNNNERFMDFNGCGIYECYQQRGYLEGYIEIKNIKNLKKYLEPNLDIYYSIEYPDELFITNIPFQNKHFSLNRSIHYIKNSNKIINLEEWKYGWTSIPERLIRFENDILFNDNIKDILNNCIHLTLVTKDFDSEINLEKLMITYFVEIND